MTKLLRSTEISIRLKPEGYCCQKFKSAQICLGLKGFVGSLIIEV